MTRSEYDLEAVGIVTDATSPVWRVLRRILVVGVGGALGVVVVALLALLATNPGERDTDDWQRMADLPEDRTEMAATVVSHDGREHLVLVGGFRAPVAATSAAVRRWDPATDRWARLPSLPDPRHHAAATSRDGSVYVSGGGSSVFDWDPSDDLWVLRPDADDWEALASLPEGRLGHRMEVVDDRLLVIGGDGPSARVLILDLDGGGWSRGAPMPVQRDHLGTVVLDGEVWAIGGRSDDQGVQRRVDIYDPASDQWRAGPELPREISAAVTGVVDGRVHVVGGEDPGLLGGRVFAAHLILEPDAGRWRDGPLPVVDVHGAGGGTVEGDLVVAGGSRRQGVLTPLALTGVTQRYPAPPVPAP